MALLNSGVGNYILSGGKKYTYFAGNNYLGLANHPKIKKAAIDSIEKYGVNFSASRQTTGTSDIHLLLEKNLAAFKGKEDAVIFASGYLGNRILLDVLKKRYSSIYIDELAHPSIKDSIPADIKNVRFYEHCRPEHLGILLDKFNPSAPLIITDGIFALTGEIAPLDKIYELVEKHKGIMVVDDAHSTGILGKTGKGTPEHFNLSDKGNIFQSETMSKALGSYGGFISGDYELTSAIRKSSIYQASTALPPPLIAAGLAALKIIESDRDMQLRLLEKADSVRNVIIKNGFKTSGLMTPIIPVFFDTQEKARDLSAFLEKNGIIVPYINYPVKEPVFMLRITISADHTDHQTGLLIEMLNKWKKKYGTD